MSSKTPKSVTASLAIDPAYFGYRDEMLKYDWRRDMPTRAICEPGQCGECDRNRMQELMNYTTNLTYTWSRSMGKTMTMQSLVDAVYSITKEGDDMYEGQSVNDSKLLKNLKKLDMDDDTQLLVDAKVIDDKGNLTREGFAFVLTVLFNENRSLIVGKLQAIKDANAPKTDKALEAGKASA